MSVNSIFENNLNHRKANFKQFSYGYPEPELAFKDVIRRFCNCWLQEEFQHMSGTEHYGRVKERSDYRNGYYNRVLVTSHGCVDLKVPRGRKNKYKYTLFNKYSRRTKTFDNAVISSLILGHSTRKSERFFDEMLGEGTISHSLASSIFARFDIELKAWRKRQINKKAKVLFLDAVHVKGAISGYKRAKPVMFAYAIYEDGKEEILDYQVAQSESQISWEEFCAGLYRRGLEDVEMIVRDDRGSIKQAGLLFWPKATQQYCVFHLLQNFCKYLKTSNLEKKEQAKIRKKTRELFDDIESKESFYKKYQIYLNSYGRYKSLKAMKYLMLNIDESIKYLEMPKEYQIVSKTNNRLERMFKEFKRRIKVMGRFPNRLSCERWLYALIKSGLTPKYRGITVKNKFTQDS